MLHKATVSDAHGTEGDTLDAAASRRSPKIALGLWGRLAATGTTEDELISWRRETLVATATSKLLTLVFTDLVGSTALKTQKGDVAAGEIIGRHRARVMELAGRNDGRIIDWAGDGCFLTFETPSAAAQFALGLQAAHRDDSTLPGVRIGVHVGEVREKRQDGAVRVEGLAVDLASRVQSLAAPGQILMSTEVFNSARQQMRFGNGDAALAWRAHGPYVLKGTDEPLGICEVGIEGLSPLVAPPNSEKASRAVQPHEEAAFGWRPAVGQPVPGRQHWVLERQLGVGGFGEVWLALNTLSKDRRVFKFCFEPERIRGLKREVALFRILKQKLGSHEGIARLLDWELENSPYFIEAEYTEGGDLKDWAVRQGGLAAVPLETRLDIVAQVAAALAEAHRAGVLHKDIKPANILIRASTGAPHAIITDFGIGLLLDPQALKQGAMGATGLTNTLLSGSSTSTSGTAMYIAPELVEGKAPSERSDIYALGVMLYQFAVGDFSRALAPGWERDIADPLLREDIAACVDGQPEKRLQDCGTLAERLRTIGQRRQVVESARRRRRALQGIAYAAAAVLLLGGIGAVASYARQGRHTRDRETWARNEALPQIRELIADEKFFDAYQLALDAQKVIPSDPALQEAVGASSNEIAIRTTPPGAKVMYKPYRDPDHAWVEAGIAPLEKVRLPLGFYRWRLEFDGYEAREFVEVVREGDRGVNEAASPIATLYKDAYTLEFALYRAADTPQGTIPIDEGGVLPGLVGLPVLNIAPVSAFFVDRTEVTNRDYYEFVAAGGYDKPEYWTEKFTRDGAEASFEEARKTFIDQTGKTGPAAWELGRFAAGKEDYPVSGVSWYEAMAYARFRGKTLPTIYHWGRAAHSRFELAESFSPYIVPMSNFEGEGPAPVGKFKGMGFGGALDIAGNVREWCFTADGQGNHYCLGGAWNDVGYMFNQGNALTPWDRSATNGFRCIAMPGGKAIPAQLAKNVEVDRVDFDAIVPASNETFAALRSGFAYTPGAGNARVEKRGTVRPGVVEELVRVDSPAGDDDLILHVYLAEGKPGPFPAVIFFPGIDCLIDKDFNPPYLTIFDFVVQSGRAFVFPEYQGTYTRGGGKTIGKFFASPTGARDFFASAVKDVGGTIDYLTARPDMDTSKVAFIGLSLGSGAGVYVLAIEKRISVGILVSGGLVSLKNIYADPATNPINFLSRITQPVILISGKYDYTFPVESSQKPLMARLGTPEENKKHVVLEGGHFPLPRLPMMNETLAWLDKYQPLPK
jgi:serine/threonine protein kinase/class 3 adenylate cyclase/formylglycine-generating enzyme required for sulfatase activity/dienelactone hydrolase